MNYFYLNENHKSINITEFLLKINKIFILMFLLIFILFIYNNINYEIESNIYKYIK